VAILVRIVTASSVLLIPVLYWALAGMAVGYVQMTAIQPTAQNESKGDE